MIEPKTIEVDEMEFYLQPLPALKAIKLDKRVLSLVIPVLGGIKSFSLDSDIDMETLARGLSEAVSKLEDNDFEKLTIDLLSGASYIEKGSPPQEITADIINNIFRGKILSLYKLMFEVMRYNKFSPFGLVEGGNIIQKIITSVNPKDSEKKTGNKLAKSGNLLES